MYLPEITVSTSEALGEKELGIFATVRETSVDGLKRQAKGSYELRLATESTENTERSGKRFKRRNREVLNAVLIKGVRKILFLLH